MTLYELYRYTSKQIVEIEYLLDQAKRFDILDKELLQLFKNYLKNLTLEKNLYN